MLFMKFASQDQRREAGGSAFVELAFCRRAGEESLFDVQELPFWQDDSLYVRDENSLCKAYGDILGKGRYHSRKEGLLDIYGVNYYSPSRLEEIIARVRGQKPMDWETLLPWLEQARGFNGFYILGL